MSRDPNKPGCYIPAQLEERGFRIIPVNPSVDELLGHEAVNSLSEVDEPVDVVDVFRPSAEAADIARQAVAIGAKALWLQLGIESDAAREIAEEAGLDYVENRCMGAEAAAHDIRKIAPSP
ncbi:MAG: CoA-binding protein [Actinomycetota bacterium]|nr:CoA-binding protein [Actinomycetota bacterium]